MEPKSDKLPDWLKGKSLKKDPYKIPGDPFIETILVNQETGQHIQVRRSSTKNEMGDPFNSIDLRTGDPVTLTDEQRHKAYLDLSINPPVPMVRKLEAKQSKDNI